MLLSLSKTNCITKLCKEFLVFELKVTILAVENVPIWIRYSAGEGSPIAERLRSGRGAVLPSACPCATCG